MVRTRGVPLQDFDRRLESGLGWACAGQAMTPFEQIADNPWGPVDEVRQIPDLETRFEIPAVDGYPALHAVLTDCGSPNGHLKAPKTAHSESGALPVSTLDHPCCQARTT